MDHWQRRICRDCLITRLPDQGTLFLMDVNICKHLTSFLLNFVLVWFLRAIHRMSGALQGVSEIDSSSLESSERDASFFLYLPLDPRGR